MRQITLNRQLLGLEDLLFGTGTVTQNRANQVVTITEINAGNLPFDKTRTLVEFAQDTNLEELGNSVEAINNINNNLDKLLIIEDNLPIINNVEAIKESIVTLDTNILALQNIYTNMSSINTVEDNLPEVVSVAQNIVPNLTEILNVDTLAAQVTQDKSDVSSMKLVVETIYDTFDDRFLGTKIVDPTLDNDGNALIDGAMYFNTSSNTMKVYDVGTTTWYSIPQVYLSALLDVQLTSITSGNVLRWNGTKWINYTLSKSDVGLNLVDNTADSAKNVLSSTKLTTARTINGVSFDGMANITISDSTAVKLTGNQTIEDVKTFTSSPIVPTPTTNTQAANKAYVDNTIIDQIGLIDYGYVAKDYHIVAFGGEFNRAVYPKLWAYLQANPTLVKTQAQWQAEATTNGGICGFFSSGDGTTTFRVPNLDKAFLRPNSRGVGSYQGDAFQGHFHGSILFNTAAAVYGTSQGVYTAEHYSTTAVREPTTDGTNGAPRTASETRPKNIAVLPLIVAK